MFINTMAVGPLELVASCVTGGTGVANERNWFALVRCHSEVVGVLFNLESVVCDALLVSWVIGCRKAMFACCGFCRGDEICDAIYAKGIENITDAPRKGCYAKFKL
jgi:hypothetical protein